MNEEFDFEVMVKGLTLGKELSPQKVKEEICPSCQCKMPICELHMNLQLKNPDVRFVCPDMRAWVRQGN